MTSRLLTGPLLSITRQRLAAAKFRAFTTTPRAQTGPPLFSMAEKVGLITGAAKGLGYEFCRAFLKAGCTKLAILDVEGEESKEAARQLTREGSSIQSKKPEDFNIIGIPCDVSHEPSVISAFKEVHNHFGRLDACIASAGIVDNQAAIGYPIRRAKQLFDINVHGVFLTAREAAQIMIPQGKGSIVLISSMSANIVNIPEPQTPYNASKAAVKHMAASLAVEWAKKGVRVNSLSPGYTATNLTKHVLANDKELKEQWEKLTPMGRMGQPKDLDGAIIFMCSDASEYMTGAEVRVDGGYTLI